ncbi:NucA/NucB deoxyribonuclease domain-containing protein, partial [Nonomuraea angiospora]|uniref:NucA/NucB deoxyribonuclease domain-containing protein n=1 Tax=Nonomuraea angiospora TaxID=46172 RepID=UPI00344EDFC8
MQVTGEVEYPDLTQPKNIPGGSWNKTLRRNGYEATKDGNRTTAKTVCKKELAPSPLTDPDCDEFPFASTLEGAARATPPHNFSVAWVDGTENDQHGLVLDAWYQNNRILNSDEYWVDLQQPWPGGGGTAAAP